MSRSGPRPPRWAVALLHRVLPEGAVAASVEADLEEEFRERSVRWTRHRVRAWYAYETLKITMHFAWTGLAGWIRRFGRGGGGMDRHKQNLRFALRQFARSPGFTATALGTIALGIGATVAIFSLVDAVLLDPLPYEDADELVAVWEWNLRRDNRKNVANPGNFAAWRDQSEAFARMTAVSLLQPAKLEGGLRPDEVMIQYAAPNFFSMLGIEAAVGRTFQRDLTSVETTEVVISDRYWRQSLGADPGVVGRTFRLNETPVVVVGILPPDYVVFGEGTDAWASIDIELGDQTNTGRWLMVVGRLAEGATLEIADAELKTIAARLEEEFPEFDGGWSVNLVPLREEIVGDVRAILWVLMGSVGLLLLIACGNVANLFLVRATARQNEMAVRRSLGATGGALVGQLMTESALLASAGAALGVGAAYMATRWMSTTMPDAFSIPRIEGASIDPGVLGFAALLTVGTAIVFGLLPGLQVASRSPASLISAEERGATRRTGRLRDALVVAEVGLSVVLLAGAALLVRSFDALMSVDDGIEPENVIVGRVNLSGDKYDGRQPKIAFFQELMERVSARPNVEAAGGITFLPMDGMGAATSYWPDDRPEPAPQDRLAADVRCIEADYFPAMGIELLQGRTFDRRDRDEGARSIVVNRALAERQWPGESAIGKRIVVDWDDRTPWQIVGVVEDVRLDGPGTEPGETVYLPYAAAPFFPWLQVVVRGSGDPSALSAGVRTELAALDEALPLGNVRVMEQIVRRSVAQPRVTSLLMTIFAGLATLLAAVGLYGVLAYAVSRRVREIGVRIALGAEPRRVVGLVIGEGTRLVAIGLALGIGGALLARPYVEALLFQVDAGDPGSFFAAAVVIFLVSVLACTVPAWRASHIAPVEALRPE